MFIKSFNLINSGAYVGSKKNNWVPESERFLAGYKNGIAIYNIAISSFFFQRALNFVSRTVASGGRGFFFGLVNPNEKSVNSAILRYQHLNQVVTKKNWRGGYVTNTKYFRSSILNGNNKFSFVVSLKFDYTNFPVIAEAARIRLPLIMPVDSNSITSNFMYPIPSNSTGSGITQIYGYAFANSVFLGVYQRISRIPQNKTRPRYLRKSNSFSSYKQNNINGRRWNRTTAVSFSGLNSTIELSPNNLKYGKNI